MRGCPIESPNDIWEPFPHITYIIYIIRTLINVNEELVLYEQLIIYHIKEKLLTPSKLIFKANSLYLHIPIHIYTHISILYIITLTV